MENSPFFTGSMDDYIFKLQGVTPAVNLNQIKKVKTFITTGYSKYNKPPETT